MSITKLKQESRMNEVKAVLAVNYNDWMIYVEGECVDNDDVDDLVNNLVDWSSQFSDDDGYTDIDFCDTMNTSAIAAMVASVFGEVRLVIDIDRQST